MSKLLWFLSNRDTKAAPVNSARELTRAALVPIAPQPEPFAQT